MPPSSSLKHLCKLVLMAKTVAYVGKCLENVQMTLGVCILIVDVGLAVLYCTLQKHKQVSLNVYLMHAK